MILLRHNNKQNKLIKYICKNSADIYYDLEVENNGINIKNPLRVPRDVLKLWIYACYMIDYPRQMNKFAGVV